MARSLRLVLLALVITALGGAAETTEMSEHAENASVFTMEELPEVAWFAPFFSGGGYSSEAIAFAEALDSAGARVSAVQHGDGYDQDFVSGLPASLRQRLKRLSRASLRNLASAVAICHSEPGAWAVPTPRWPTALCPPSGVGFAVGRTMFETDRLPDGWHLRLNQMDQLWVPTHFAKDIFEANGVEPDKLRVLGEPVDVEFFDPVKHTPLTIEGVGPDTFVLLSIFKWEPRKGWDVLLRAYFTEYSIHDDVVLVILTNAYHSSSNFAAQVTALASEWNLNLNQLPRVVFHPKVAQQQLPQLFKAAHCFVLPSRGEGWGRPHVEAMAMGLPVIATNWSGHTEYLKPHNGYPLPILPGLVPVPANSAFAGHLWADPDHEALRELMRHVQTHREEAAAKGKNARADMVEKYSPAVLAERTGELLHDLVLGGTPRGKRKAKKGAKASGSRPDQHEL